MSNKLKSAPIRYGTRFGCRWGVPHDYIVLSENKRHKTERCKICRKRVRWNKTNTGRIDNIEYLKEHVRQLAQKFGSTKRVYNNVHNPNKLKITL